MKSKALLAALLIIIVSVWPSSATEAWPVESKYFSFDRELTDENRHHHATEAEAAELGSVMDQIHERYRAAGFPEPLLDKTSSGRWNVEIIYQNPIKYNGVYQRKPVLRGVPSRFIDSERLIDSIVRLNIVAYRKFRTAFSHTLAHEYFHAIQANMAFGKPVFKAYTETNDELATRRFDWIMEGTADAAAQYTANGIGGYSNSPSSHLDGDRHRLAGLRSYAGPLHMDPPDAFPRYPGLGAVASYKQNTYNSSSFWRFLAAESAGLQTLRILLEPPVKEPIDALSLTEWVHDNIKRLPLSSGAGKRFPGGLPQAYAEFIAEFSDLPFNRRYGHFFVQKNEFDEGIWHALVFGPTGSNRCATIDLTAGQPKSTQVLSVQEFGSACFHLSLSDGSSTPPSAFEVNIVAELPSDETYVCQAVGLASNSAVIKQSKNGSLTGAPQGCMLNAPITYAPRTNMIHQTVVITNVHAAGGNGSVLGTRFVRVRVEFTMGSATASGQMVPSQQSSSAPPPPPTPGAPAAAPGSASTGKNISINSTSARARGKQARHAKPREKADCGQWPDRCPQIEIDLAQYDQRFEAIAAMGDRLGAGALVALDGAPRQLDVIGIYGNPEKLGAMAMEMAGTEFTEVSLRLRAPEGRIEKGMRWDDAVITALVGTMEGEENVDMTSRGPYPKPGACGSEPPATGTVDITDVGEGWISGTFSADLFERYVHEPGKDRCAVRPSNGIVSGTFTAPYVDITQPPVDPALAAYKVWAGLPAITWALTDYDDLVEQAVATQRDILRDWEAERRPVEPLGAGGGVGGPSAVACSKTCVPGMAGCPNIPEGEAERLAEDYLAELPDMMRDNMRKVLANTPPEGRSMMLAIHFDRKGCMEALSP